MGLKPPESLQETLAASDPGEGSGRRAVGAVSARYGLWAGNPKGYPENPLLCREEVWPRFKGYVSAQCSRKRGHGEGQAYCSIHAKSTKNIRPIDPTYPRK